MIFESKKTSVQKLVEKGTEGPEQYQQVVDEMNEVLSKGGGPIVTANIRGLKHWTIREDFRRIKH